MLRAKSNPARGDQHSSRRRGSITGWFFRLRLVRRILGIAGFVLVALILVIVSLRWIAPPCSTFMIIRQFERWLPSSDVPPIHYTWVDREQINPNMLLAVIAAEDQHFPDHWGFDFTAISRAITYNSRSSKMRGASTISQQTAKNLFLWSGRSYLRKGLEAALTLSLELLWPKKRILEVYLNIAEFGDGIYGVHAASFHFFGKSPAQLSRYEAALLAGVLPSPRRLHADRPSRYLRSRAQWITSQMRNLDGPRYLQRL
jgi:monofunctional biosynthetic peptidoglycan transglycosylase